MKHIKNIRLGIILTALLTFTLNTTFAQTHSERDLTSDEIKRLTTDRKLTADKVTTKMELAVIDSIQMQYELNEEADELSPADELYDGAWNNRYVKAYANISIPDSFRIDLSNFVMPVEGKITSPFGPRRRRFHYGTDIKLQTGDTVYAAFDGKVRVKQYERKGYGYYLVLRHPNGLETVYGHLSRFLVEEGESVGAGQPIALGGNTGRSTGPHLHFECRFLGQAIDPADIVDFDNFCTFDDSYVFQKYRVNEISMHNNKYTAYDRTVQYHRIRSGDTLSIIAGKYGVSVNQLCRLNGLRPTSTLKVGRVLRCS
ncbi:MAG: M23 family metallopeptidase [Candidatus Azobacteroides sp.]|nr:M23 family metallopeptidase [Candidatus Azobacteroides sp.]